MKLCATFVKESVNPVSNGDIRPARPYIRSRNRRGSDGDLNFFASKLNFNSHCANGGLIQNFCGGGRPSH